MTSSFFRHTCLGILLMSFTICVHAQVGGSGTNGFIAKWSASTTLNNSKIFQNPVNGRIGIFTTTPSAPLDVRGQVSSIVTNSRALVGVSTGTVQTLEIQNNIASGTGFLLSAFHNGVAKFFVDTNGNLTATGSKSAIVALPNGHSVALYAVESPENWFEDFGEGELKQGGARIHIDPRFAQMTNTEGYHIFLTPKGECKGLYVSRQDTQSFDVREIERGTSTVRFDYRIVAHRKGYEGVRLEDETGKVPKLLKPVSPELNSFQRATK